MNTVLLNTISLDGETVIKKGIPINNQSKSVEFTENGTSEVRYDAGYTGLEKVSVKVAIPTESKSVTITENGTTEVVAANGFLSKVVVNTNVASSGGGTTPSRPTYTGRADAEGLKAIGWDDDDIAYYQQHGVNWNAEDDEYHKVTDDNKALYGVLTADNISTYRDRIVYLPKIDTSKVTNMDSMFASCPSLVSIPLLDTSNVTNMNKMFYSCYSLVSIPQLDTSGATNMSQMFYSCYSLVSVPTLDVAKNTASGYPFYGCYSLIYAYVKNIIISSSFISSSLLSKESLLYLINNEAATNAITITLAPYAYERLAEDADVVEALTNHPNISLAQ